MIPEVGSILIVSQSGASRPVRVWFVDPVSFAWLRQPDWRSQFDLVEILLGAAAKVIWVVDPDQPLYTKLDGHGFPMVLAPEGNYVGLDGLPLTVVPAPASPDIHA